MGLLDWITDGGGSLFSEGSAGPMTGNTMPPSMSPPMPPAQSLETAPPPAPPISTPNNNDVLPFAQGGDPAAGSGSGNNGGLPLPQGGDPMAGSGSGNNGGLPPAPMPTARPAGAPPPVPGAIPPPPPEQPPGAPMNISPGGAGAPPMAPQGSGFSPPDMQGRGGLLAAMGLSSDTANRLRGGIGAGLKAAGNSAGKSPMQALAGGAGETLEGGQKTSDTNNKQTIDYLNTAIKAKAAGDTATYNVNYTKYLAAKLKADTDKAASPNKNDSPTQLYLSAAEATNKSPVLNGLRDAVRKAGSPQELAQAQAALKQAETEVMNGHLTGVGLDPKVAAQIEAQPGMTSGKPIDSGLTPDNITKKLQPGQYYLNPADKGTPKEGTVYKYKGPGGAGVKGVPDKPTSPVEPRDPNRPERGSRAAADTSDTTDQDGPA